MIPPDVRAMMCGIEGLLGRVEDISGVYGETVIGDGEEKDEIYRKNEARNG